MIGSGRDMRRGRSGERMMGGGRHHTAKVHSLPPPHHHTTHSAHRNDVFRKDGEISGSHVEDLSAIK